MSSDKPVLKIKITGERVHEGGVVSAPTDQFLGLLRRLTDKE